MATLETKGSSPYRILEGPPDDFDENLRLAEDRLRERERVLVLREKRVELLLALAQATQQHLEHRLAQLDEGRLAQDQPPLQGDRFAREKFLLDPACSLLLLTTGLLRSASGAAPDLSEQLMAAVREAEARLDRSETLGATEERSAAAIDRID